MYQDQLYNECNILITNNFKASYHRFWGIACPKSKFITELKPVFLVYFRSVGYCGHFFLENVRIWINLSNVLFLFNKKYDTK